MYILKNMEVVTRTRETESIIGDLELEFGHDSFRQFTFQATPLTFQ